MSTVASGHSANNDAYLLWLASVASAHKLPRRRGTLRLDELLDTCAHSHGDHWERLEGHPMFLYELFQGGTMDEGRAEVAGAHRERATFRPDVSIGIAWGYRVHEDPEDRVTPDWVRTAGIPDQNVTQCYLDFFYNGGLVYRDYYYVADGGRLYLPFPELQDDDRLVVTQQSDSFVRLLNELGEMPYYHDFYDNYCQRAGFEFV
jgi:hypothetical protein